jgi:hypothetical protein
MALAMDANIAQPELEAEVQFTLDASQALGNGGYPGLH